MTSLLKKSRLFSAALSKPIALAVLCISLTGVTAQADSLPNIVGRDLDGKITSLHRSFDGKPTVINFWWIKCSPCKQELPDLIAKDAAYPNVDFIFVHAETNAKTKGAYEIDDVKGFLDRQALLLDRVIIGNTKARKSAGVNALPTTLLVDKQGRVDQTLVGFTPENTEKILEWLKRQ